MKKLTAVLLIFIFMLSLAACGDKNNDTVQVNIAVVDLGTEYINDGERDFMQRSIELPTVILLNETNGKIASKINKTLEEQIMHYIIEIDETHSKSLEYARDLKSAGILADFVLDFDIVDAYVSGDVLSIICEKYEYYGGAHGSSIRCALNFDLTDGHLLTFAEIAKDETALQEKLSEFIQQEMKSERYADYYFYADNDSAIKDKSYNYCWYIAEDKLNVIYGQYEIAPYAAGIIEFALPLAEIQNFHSCCIFLSYHIRRPKYQPLVPLCFTK